VRRAFIRTLVDLAALDERIVLLTGDLGFTVVEPFAETYPERFFNVGVAEQNMIGVATGLAEAGFIPFAYSIATFAVLRPYEFIRNGPVAHGLPVRVVGVGGGFEYGTAGFTHHGLEDLAVTRVLPGLTVLSPADYAQAASALRAVWDLPGPVYFRLGKNDADPIPGLDGRFSLGHLTKVVDGDDVAIVATGAIAAEAVAAAHALVSDGVRAAVLIAATLNPVDAEDFVDAIGQYPLIVTVEAHYATGGLGSTVAEVLADRGIGAQLLRIGVSGLSERNGSERFLNHAHGLSAARIAERVRAAL
jgi:transketolase